MTEISTKPCVKCGAVARSKHGDCKKCLQAWKSANRDRLREKYAAYYLADRLKRQYGLSVSEYEHQLAAQGGVCAICRKPETALSRRTKKVQALSVDHCHQTGTPRGLLCARCNHGLGYFIDNPSLLRAAASYLEACQ